MPGGGIHIGFGGNTGTPCESSDKFAVNSDEFRSLLRSSRKLLASISSGSSGNGGGGSNVLCSLLLSTSTFKLSDVALSCMASSSLKSMSILSTLSCNFLGEVPTFFTVLLFTGVIVWFVFGGGGGGGNFNCSKSKCIR